MNLSIQKTVMLQKTGLLYIALMLGFTTFAQINEAQTGAWYMYFYNHQFKNSTWGIQGDIQHRDWQLLGDKEQLLLRSGVTYKPKAGGVMLTLGVANITSGEFGTSTTSTNENRVYQEALLPHKIGTRLLMTHRFRYEQRFVEQQDFRTRYRYNVFVNIPFNDTKLSPKTIYAAFYNELFINGERATGNNNSVEIFDRNRTYAGLGYVLNKKIRFQFGWMKQTTNTWAKSQLQLSMHHTF